MRSIGGALALVIVLAVVGFMALRQPHVLAPPGVAASAGVPSGPDERAQAAQERAVVEVNRAMEAASASRDAAEAR